MFTYIQKVPKLSAIRSGESYYYLHDYYTLNYVQVELWEAVVTFLFLPLLIMLAFTADKNYCMGQSVKSDQMEIGWSC